jgi:hypothetical protein
MWCLLFQTALLVFVLDHKGALQALNVSPCEFVARCSREFHRCAVLMFEGDLSVRKTVDSAV